MAASASAMAVNSTNAKPCFSDMPLMRPQQRNSSSSSRSSTRLQRRQGGVAGCARKSARVSCGRPRCYQPPWFGHSDAPAPSLTPVAGEMHNARPTELQRRGGGHTHEPDRSTARRHNATPTVASPLGTSRCHAMGPRWPGVPVSVRRACTAPVATMTSTAALPLPLLNLRGEHAEARSCASSRQHSALLA
jgi:hypothetical protein